MLLAALVVLAALHFVRQNGAAAYLLRVVHVSDTANEEVVTIESVSFSIDSASSLEAESTVDDKRDVSRKRAACATTYARRLSRLLEATSLQDKSKSPPDIEAFVLDRMAHSVSSAKEAAIRCPPGLVVNAAPGSSGTRSFFLATALMNVPSAHYRVTATGNCSLGSAKTGSFMKATQVYGDTPYSNKWWSIIHACPMTKTVFTLVNSSKWYETRRRDHARLAYKRWPSTFPIPFEPPKDSGIIRSQFQLKAVTADIGAKAYALFLDLVKCAVPRKNLLIIDYTKLDPPARFWGKLNAFLGAGLGEDDLQSLVAAGLPYWGHAKCFFGSPSRPCPTTLFKEARVSYKGMGLPGPCN
jgi:hypothetical protein